VSPANKAWCKNFSLAYTEICKKCNVKLAGNCPSKEKAFENSSEGKVLGIWFNSSNLTWRMSEKKIFKISSVISEAASLDQIPLELFQSLMGSLNSFAQLMPFMKNFKKPLNDCLSEAILNGSCSLSSHAKKDLCIWAACVRDCLKGFPIPHRPSAPPPSVIRFSFRTPQGFLKEKIIREMRGWGGGWV
jgi:hypothetical protein